MLTRLTRIEVDGFRSLHDVVLRPRPLEVFLDPRGTATQDLVAVFTLLREVAEGRLQQHLARSRVLDGPRAPEVVRLELGVHYDLYRLELRCSPDGMWRIASEELALQAGVSMYLTEPAKDAPREESLLPTYAAQAPGDAPRTSGSSADGEAEYLGFVMSHALWTVRQFLRGFRVQPAESFDLAEGTFLFLEEPDLDLPANAAWDRARHARAAASQSSVLLCTPSATLADAFDPKEVHRVDTADGISRFQPLVPRQDD